ncbi:carbon-nitrogen hydrolase family protein [Pelagibius sp. Alg239-R121]|uniref:carbon-nitrogen hydrolase family protein n=1 Tax=Pelagibius sp. Alg239-R121 TaxID=2993448 RepID=UPI0024A6FE54|nr:carbon-nitrogen hydrolase family protein [Pelagibius sp. Alg239-R121]
MRLLACQIDIPSTATPDARDRHLDSLERRVSEALVKTPADLVVLPELSAIDYSRESFARLDLLAEDLEGPSFERFREIAKRFDIAVVYGIPRKGDDGYHISQVAVGPDGAVIGCFDKLHLAQYGASMEKEYFTRGKAPFSFSFRGVKIAPIICYDIRFPELSRSLALEHGVDLILHCGAYARDRSFYSWHHFVVSRALENQLYFLSLNRAGVDFGHSIFCPPWIDEELPALTFPEHAEAFVRCDVDLEQMKAVRREYSFLADRLARYGNAE